MMAFGTSMIDGYGVPLAGQDSGRGTFSRRHALLFDYVTGAGYVPLNALARNISPSRPADPVVLNNALSQDLNDAHAEVSFAVYDSLLSEYGVLGFEYGYSVADPGALVMWEAQFGDFVNGAQIVVDQFISSAEERGGQPGGLGLLLRLGNEGRDPDPPAARLERFLRLGPEENLRV